MGPHRKGVNEMRPRSLVAILSAALLTVAARHDVVAGGGTDQTVTTRSFELRNGGSPTRAACAGRSATAPGARSSATRRTAAAR
jgi:hypothetical protein